MTTSETFESNLNEIERMEAEAGCELPELSSPTLRERAERLLNCDDPPKGADLELCRRIANG